MGEEARLERVASGLAPVTPGWFVVNVADTAWVDNDHFGGVAIFEADEFIVSEGGYEKPLAGFTIRVFGPGQPSGLYHAEPRHQEDFLVLKGECILLVEEQERRLRTWDFVHLPPGTPHAFVGAGDGPCVLLGTGNRVKPLEVVRPRSELALSYDAGVEEETTRFPHERYGPWRLERPAAWSELPWAT